MPLARIQRHAILLRCFPLNPSARPVTVIRANVSQQNRDMQRPFMRQHSPWNTFKFVIVNTALSRVRGDYRRGLDSCLDLLTTYAHHSELRVITVLSLVSTLYRSPQHPLSLLPSLLCLHKPFPSNGLQQWGFFSFLHSSSVFTVFRTELSCQLTTPN
jgi:hypothetical protein